MSSVDNQPSDKPKEIYYFKCIRCSYKTSIKANFIRHTKRKYPCTYNFDTNNENTLSNFINNIDFNNWLIHFLSGKHLEIDDIYEYVNKTYNLNELSKDETISKLVDNIRDITNNFEHKIYYLKTLCLIANKFTTLEYSEETRKKMITTLLNTIEMNQIVNDVYDKMNI